MTCSATLNGAMLIMCADRSWPSPAWHSKDEKYQNAMKNSDKQNAHGERARVATGDLFHYVGQHGAIQAVSGQSFLQEMVVRYGVQHDVSNEHMMQSGGNDH